MTYQVIFNLIAVDIPSSQNLDDDGQKGIMENDEQFALSLVRTWAQSLVDDADGEATAEFIDLLEGLPADSEPYDDEPRLRSLFGLIGGLHYLLLRASETAEEHQLVLDAFTDAMRLLAAALSERGHQIEIPDVRPH